MHWKNGTEMDSRDSRSRVVQIRTLTKMGHSQTALGAHKRIERVGGYKCARRKSDYANFYFIGRSPELATVDASADKENRPSNTFC